MSGRAHRTAGPRRSDHQLGERHRRRAVRRDDGVPWPPAPGLIVHFLARLVVERVLDATIWPNMAGGCRTHRDTAAAIVDAGFTITDLQHVRFPDLRITLPTSANILGTALRA